MYKVLSCSSSIQKILLVLLFLLLSLSNSIGGETDQTEISHWARMERIPEIELKISVWFPKVYYFSHRAFYISHF